MALLRCAPCSTEVLSRIKDKRSGPSLRSWRAPGASNGGARSGSCCSAGAPTAPFDALGRQRASPGRVSPGGTADACDGAARGPSEDALSAAGLGRSKSSRCKQAGPRRWRRAGSCDPGPRFISSPKGFGSRRPFPVDQEAGGGGDENVFLPPRGQKVHQSYVFWYVFLAVGGRLGPAVRGPRGYCGHGNTHGQRCADPVNHEEVFFFPARAAKK